MKGRWPFVLAGLVVVVAVVGAWTFDDAMALVALAALSVLLAGLSAVDLSQFRKFEAAGPGGWRFAAERLERTVEAVEEAVAEVDASATAGELEAAEMRGAAPGSVEDVEDPMQLRDSIHVQLTRGERESERRLGLEKAVSSAVELGWLMGRAGRDLPPGPLVRWESDGRPVVAFDTAFERESLRRMAIMRQQDRERLEQDREREQEARERMRATEDRQK